MVLECAIHGSELVTEQTVKDELLCWQTWDGLLVGLYDMTIRGLYIDSSGRPIQGEQTPTWINNCQQLRIQNQCLLTAGVELQEDCNACIF